MSANDALTRPFDPDWGSPPADTIVDWLEERGIARAALAARMPDPAAFVAVMDADGPIDEAMADALSRLVCASPAFWRAREAQWRAWQARDAARRADAGT